MIQETVLRADAGSRVGTVWHEPLPLELADPTAIASAAPTEQSDG